MIIRICEIDGCGRKHRARGLCSRHHKRQLKYGTPHGGGTLTGEPHEFVSRIPGTGDGCLLWPYSRNNMGYALINIGNGVRRLVSRITCEKQNGPPPTPEHQAAHSCGKGHEGCIAPWHLCWKTREGNMADKAVHGTQPRGSSVYGSKLTESIVRDIRSMSATTTQRKIAEKFGINQSCVSLIVSGKRWSHVQENNRG